MKFFILQKVEDAASCNRLESLGKDKLSFCLKFDKIAGEDKNMLDNKLGLTSSSDLAREEERISKKKASELFEKKF